MAADMNSTHQSQLGSSAKVQLHEPCSANSWRLILARQREAFHCGLDERTSVLLLLLRFAEYTHGLDPGGFFVMNPVHALRFRLRRRNCAARLGPHVPPGCGGRCSALPPRASAHRCSHRTVGSNLRFAGWDVVTQRGTRKPKKPTEQEGVITQTAPTPFQAPAKLHPHMHCPWKRSFIRHWLQLGRGNRQGHFVLGRVGKCFVNQPLAPPNLGPRSSCSEPASCR